MFFILSHTHFIFFLIIIFTHLFPAGSTARTYNLYIPSDGPPFLQLNQLTSVFFTTGVHGLISSNILGFHILYSNVQPGSSQANSNSDSDVLSVGTLFSIDVGKNESLYHVSALKYLSLLLPPNK